MKIFPSCTPQNGLLNELALDKRMASAVLNLDTAALECRLAEVSSVSQGLKLYVLRGCCLADGQR